MKASKMYQNRRKLPLRNLHGRPAPKNKKETGEIYRSANFSTTRTLSPRTVIGIGTTLS